jgi:N-acetylneuraminic acid mutarotase
MLTYKRISAICSLGLVVAACGEPSTQPDTTTTSLQATPLLSTPVTGTWRKMPSIVPARAEMAAAVIDKSIVVVGGFNMGGWKQRFAVRRVDAYNVETGTWTQLRSLPEPRFRHGATTIRGKIYVAGGVTVITDPDDPKFGDLKPHNSLFVYDPVTDRWSRKADMPQPTYESKQAKLFGRLYVYAPGNDFAPDRFSAYRPATDKWVSLAPPPSRHIAGAMAALDGKLYLTDGLSQTLGNNGELDVYDPATGSWTVKSPKLLPGSGTVAATFHGKLWIAGSPSELVSQDGGQQYLSLRGVQVYDPVADEWNHGPLMLSSSRGGAAAWAGGRFFVIGGFDNDGELTGVVQALRTSY